MRVLVTGGSGFIGSNLVDALLERGDEVDMWDIRTNGRDVVTHAFMEEPYDVIYHLACVSQEQAVKHPEKNIITNIMGTRRVANYAAEVGARLVYTSTASVYGATRYLPTKVGSQTAPRSDYAVAKYAGEWFVRNSGAKFTIFRLSNVYGPGQSTENPYCGVVAKFFESALHGQVAKIYGTGKQTRDFTFVGDVVDVLLNEERGGILNCSYGHETSVYDLAHKIYGLVGADLRLECVPERPVDGINRRLLQSDVICPTNLKNGLERTLQWITDEEEDISGRIGRSAAV